MYRHNREELEDQRAEAIEEIKHERDYEIAAWLRNYSKSLPNDLVGALTKLADELEEGID